MKIPLFTKWVLCLAFVAFTGAMAASNAPASIVGTWSGIDDQGIEGAFIFRADGSADMLKSGVSMKDTVVKDQGTLTYRLDRSVIPIALDIILTRKDGTVYMIRCIAEFLSPEKMRVRLPDGETRAPNFSGPKNKVLVVERAVGK